MPLPINDITHPEVLKFLIESYERTSKLRMKWNVTHEKLMTHAATLDREEKGYDEIDVYRSAMASAMPTIRKDHINACRNKRTKPVRDATFVPGVKHLRKSHPIEKIGLQDGQKDPRLLRPDTDLNFDPVMRPIDLKTKQILYKEVPNFGREVYLKKRSKILPEDRYYFRETEGWECGWRLKDSYFSKLRARYGRVSKLSKDRSITGPQPDPEHYKKSDPPGVSKCFIEL